MILKYSSYVALFFNKFRMIAYRNFKTASFYIWVALKIPLIAVN